MKWRILILSAVIAVTGAAFAGGAVHDDRKIDMLIEYVRSLNGAVFIRNGMEYPPAQAAEHFAMKRKKAGSRIKSAGDFIELVASKSYLTGVPYTVEEIANLFVLHRNTVRRWVKDGHAVDLGVAVHPRGLRWPPRRTWAKAP